MTDDEKEAESMTEEESIRIAAITWCEPETASYTMDTNQGMAIARTIRRECLTKEEVNKNYIKSDKAIESVAKWVYAYWHQAAQEKTTWGDLDPLAQDIYRKQAKRELRILANET